MRTRLCIALGVLLASAGAGAQLPVEIHRNQPELLPSAAATLTANKKLVFDFWREVVQAHRVERAPDYIAEGYVDHDPSVATDRAAFIDRARQLQPAPMKDTVDNLVALVAERDLVVLAFRRTLPDLEHEGQTYATTWFDMFRVADGKIVEHWNYGTRD